MKIWLALLLLVAACAHEPRLAPSAPPAPPAVPATDPLFSVKVTGQGPPVLFIPGLSSPGSVWDDAVAHLSARYTCHVFTLAGFAGVPPVPGPFLPRERDAVLAYIRDHKLERPVIVGHSLGAFLAFWIASEAPASIAGVLAVDGVPFLPALMDPAATPASVEAGAASVRDLFADMKVETFAAQNRSALTAMITRPEDVERVAEASGKSDPRTTGLAVYELMTTDLRPGLAGFPGPVWLVVAGAEARDAFAAQVAGAPDHRVLVAENARHFVMLDDPAFMRATLDAFLAAL